MTGITGSNWARAQLATVTEELEEGRRVFAADCEPLERIEGVASLLAVIVELAVIGGWPQLSPWSG